MVSRVTMLKSSVKRNRSTPTLGNTFNTRLSIMKSNTLRYDASRAAFWWGSLHVYITRERFGKVINAPEL